MKLTKEEQTLALRLGRKDDSMPRGREPGEPTRLVDDTPPPRRRTGLSAKRNRIALLIALLIVVVGSSAYGYDRVTSETFYPGTRIGGVDVGGRSPTAAAALLGKRLVAPLHEPITLSARDFEAKATRWELGMRVNVKGAVREAMLRQRKESLPARLAHRTLGDGRALSLRPTVDEKVLQAYVDKIAIQFNRPATNARLSYSAGNLHVSPHSLGRKVNSDQTRERVLAAMGTGRDSVELPVEDVQPAVRSEYYNTVILISTSGNTLKLYRGGGVARSYGVATGTGGYPTPHGQFSITAKRYMPTWVNPGSEWAKDLPPSIPPGRNNPLGTRALNISASGIRIHGTPDADSIGTNASHGCIRMHMADVEELYELVNVGTPVLIVG